MPITHSSQTPGWMEHHHSICLVPGHTHACVACNLPADLAYFEGKFYTQATYTGLDAKTGLDDQFNYLPVLHGLDG